ncbi:MAG: pyridine nucleotide-disulfide oxidoreductase family protein [Rubritepida sp.]|nr:pyridine nucleotide-disulfide oxidoreductase family protein [Rubritepida sp.]
MRTVIVGAGQAGRRTAELLRGLDAEREILLIGEEAEPPYDRPPLSKEILLGEKQPPGLMQRAAGAYAEQRIELLLGCRVTGIDLAARRLDADDGERVPFDTLVLATGARARRLRIPGAEDPRVLTLRSMADARALGARLRPGLRLAVAGAGLIGLEVAASATKLGCLVTVLEAADRVMARCVPEATSALLDGWHREAGVALHLSCPLLSITPGEASLRLSTGLGDIEADLLLVAIGAVPNDELARQAGLPVEDGILVDESGRTSHAQVFAAGEVARIWRPALGQHVRYETWQVAQHQPVAVAHALCGAERPYDEIPWHWTNQYGRNIQLLGAHRAGLEWIARAEGDRQTVIGLDGDARVQGAVLIDNGRDATPLRRLIASGKQMERARLRDGSVALRQLC